MSDAERDERIQTVFASAARKAAAEFPGFRFDVSTSLHGAWITVSDTEEDRCFVIRFVVWPDDSIFSGDDQQFGAGKLSDTGAEDAIASALGNMVVRKFG